MLKQDNSKRHIYNWYNFQTFENSSNKQYFYGYVYHLLLSFLNVACVSHLLEISVNVDQVEREDVVLRSNQQSPSLLIQ